MPLASIVIPQCCDTSKNFILISCSFLLNFASCALCSLKFAHFSWGNLLSTSSFVCVCVRTRAVCDFSPESWLLKSSLPWKTWNQFLCLQAYAFIKFFLLLYLLVKTLYPHAQSVFPEQRIKCSKGKIAWRLSTYLSEVLFFLTWIFWLGFFLTWYLGFWLPWQFSMSVNGF